MPDRDRLNACPNLSLRGYTGVRDEPELLVFVVEAFAQEPRQVETGNARADEVLGQVRPIETAPDSLVFRLTFENFVAVEIVNESYAWLEKQEPFDKKLRQHSNSSLLDRIRSKSHYDQVWPDHPLKHYAIVTLNHVINVIGPNEPRVTIEGKLADITAKS